MHARADGRAPRPAPPPAVERAAAVAPDRERTLALLALGACLLPYALALLLFPATGDQDAAIHAIFARFPTDPVRVVSVWARPLFAVPYLLPGLAGYGAIRLTTVLVCAATAWLTYLAARRLGLARPWLAVPLTLLQPALFVVGTDAMTEPTFALVLAAGVLAMAHERWALAAAVLSFLPLARPEGPVVLACLGAAWLPRAARDPRRWLPQMALLGLGTVAWVLLATAVTRSPTFLRDSFPWQDGMNPWRGSWDHYLRRWPQIVGWVPLALWLAGVRPSLRVGPRTIPRAQGSAGQVLRFSLAVTGVLVVLHSYLYATGGMGSTGFTRYFASLAPLTALVATVGASELARRLDARRWRAALGPGLALAAANAWVVLDANPASHMAAATLESIRQARRLVPGFETQAPPLLAADYFAYVLLDRDRDDDTALHSGPPAATLALVERAPRGTVVLWDDGTGKEWFHLTVEDFTARGYRLLWERRTELRSPFGALYGEQRRGAFDRARRSVVLKLFGQLSSRDFRQAVLVKE